MHRILLASTLLVLMTFNGYAEDETRSANYIQSHCKDWQADKKSAMGGNCVGIISSTMAMSEAYTAPYRFCPPNNVTLHQALAVVNQFLAANPRRWHESFQLLAIEALRAVWPCG